MKNKITVINLAIIICIISTSCNDFISSEKPSDFVSAENFFKTQAQVEQAVNGAYSTLQGLYSSPSYWEITEMRSDNTTFQYNAADRGNVEGEKLDYFSIDPSIGQLESIWADMYDGIAKTNRILDGIKANNLQGEEIDELKGQSKFIRSLLYFNLVRLFGGVPLVLKAVKSPEEAFAKGGRSSVDEIYEQIIKDAQSAADQLPASWPDAPGRATKGAAYTLLGQVYITRKDFESAVDAFEQVESLSYNLMNNYAALYDPANKNNSESIFEIQYDASKTGQQSSFIYNFAPFNSGSSIVGFNDFKPSSAGLNIPTHDMLSTYEQGDRRKPGSIAYYVDEENTQFDIAIGDSIAYIKKYAAGPVEPSKQNVDVYVYRYAQVLLWYAESLNEVDRTGEAYSYINRVRQRAGLSDLSSLSKQQFRDQVYHEERVEAAFEDNRWFQLLRTGRAQDVMTQHGQDQKAYQDWLEDITDPYNIQSYKLLLPIPVRDKRVNDLEQNPGW